MVAIKALIFDVDGTLAETEEVHRAAFNQAFREAGLNWKWTIPLYGQLLKVTGGKERMAHHAAMTGHVFEGDATEAIRRLHERKTQVYAEMVSSGVMALREGIPELISGARARGLALAIATTTTTANVTALLDAALGPEAKSWFKAMCCGDMVARKKPAPDIYELALERLGLHANEAIAIEDTRNGLLAARGAGLRVAIRPSIYSEDEDFSNADIRFEDARELLGLI